MTLSDSQISESTAPAEIRTTKSAAITGVHHIIVTSRQVNSTEYSALYDAAIAEAKKRCPEFAIDFESYETREILTNERRLIPAPWFQLRIRCADVVKVKTNDDGIKIIEEHAKDALDTEHFDVHAEAFAVDFERAFATVIRVLNSQGDGVFSADKEKGLIITGRAPHPTTGRPTYHQYYVLVDDVSPTSTKVTFKLIMHERKMDIESLKQIVLVPAPRQVVYRRAAAFVDRLKKDLR